jgi:hypothetical protein
VYISSSLHWVHLELGGKWTDTYTQSECEPHIQPKSHYRYYCFIYFIASCFHGCTTIFDRQENDRPAGSVLHLLLFSRQVKPKPRYAVSNFLVSARGPYFRSLFWNWIYMMTITKLNTLRTHVSGRNKSTSTIPRKWCSNIYVSRGNGASSAIYTGWITAGSIFSKVVDQQNSYIYTFPAEMVQQWVISLQTSVMFLYYPVVS